MKTSKSAAKQNLKMNRKEKWKRGPDKDTLSLNTRRSFRKFVKLINNKNISKMAASKIS